jgi:hypothetical protein
LENRPEAKAKLGFWIFGLTGELGRRKALSRLLPLNGAQFASRELGFLAGNAGAAAAGACKTTRNRSLSQARRRRKLHPAAAAALKTPRWRCAGKSRQLAPLLWYCYNVEEMFQRIIKLSSC